MQGIWDYNALPQYIYILENSSSQAVGLIEGLQGSFTALVGFPGATYFQCTLPIRWHSSPPQGQLRLKHAQAAGPEQHKQRSEGACCLSPCAAGWVADRTRRDSVLRASGCINALAIGLTCLAILAPQRGLTLAGYDTDNKFLLLCGAMAAWGAAYGSWPIVDSLFADSVPNGAESHAALAQIACQHCHSMQSPVEVQPGCQCHAQGTCTSGRGIEWAQSGG